MSLELHCFEGGGSSGPLPTLPPDNEPAAHRPATGRLTADPLDEPLDLERVVWDLEYRDAVMRRLKRRK